MGDARDLSEEMRLQISREEEYRREVRRALEEKDKRGLLEPRSILEKLAFPVLLIVISGIVSGFAIPWILDAQTTKNREYDSQASILEELHREAGALKVSIRSYDTALANYWKEHLRLSEDYGRLYVQRKVGVLGERDFELRDSYLENDRRALERMLDQYFDAQAHQYELFETWLPCFATRVRLLYGQKPAIRNSGSRLGAEFSAVQAAITELPVEFAAVDAAIDAKIDSYEESSRGAQARFGAGAGTLQQRLARGQLTKSAFLKELEGLSGIQESDFERLRKSQPDFSEVDKRVTRIVEFLFRNRPQLPH